LSVDEKMDRERILTEWLSSFPTRFRLTPTGDSEDPRLGTITESMMSLRVGVSGAAASFPVPLDVALVLALLGGVKWTLGSESESESASPTWESKLLIDLVRNADLRGVLAWFFDDEDIAGCTLCASGPYGSNCK